MLELTVAAALLLAILTVTRLRRLALALLGLVSIVAGGSLVFGSLVWLTYESKQWIADNGPSFLDDLPGLFEDDSESGPPTEDGLTLALAREEESVTEVLRLEDERRRLEQQRLLEEEKLRIAALAAQARAVLEEDRKRAEHAASYSLPARAGDMRGEILAIRIPAWRNKETQAFQKEAIRNWLQDVGLTAEETASISTAKAWGSLYDMWVSEHPELGQVSPWATEP